MSQATLTDTEKTELLGVLRGLDPTRRGIPPEQRRARRHGVLQWMPLQLMPRFEGDRLRTLRVMLKDVSSGGAGLYSRRPFAVGDHFVLPVRFAEGGGQLYLCRVVFSRAASPRHYAVGASFVDSIEDPDATAPVPASWLRSQK